MNIRAVRGFFMAALGMIVVGTIASENKRLEFLSFLIPVGAVFAVVLGSILIRATRGGSGLAKTGIEGVPPPGDVAAITVDGVAIPEGQKQRLMKAITKARRAGRCDKVVREVRFQIVDRWDGTWDLEAFKDAQGQRGFVVNRVAYTGRHAATVAECVGV